MTYTGDDIIKYLKNKENKLEEVIFSSYPINPAHCERHEDRVLNAHCFLQELEEVYRYLNIGLNIQHVPRPTFEKKLKNADFAILEFDGYYCKVAIIQKYAEDKQWLITTAPVNEI